MSINFTSIPANILQSSTFDCLEINSKSPLNNFSAKVDQNSSPFNYKYGLPSGIVLKNIIYQLSYFIGSSDKGTLSFYDRYFLFPIPRNLGYLAQCILEITLTSSGDNSLAKPRIGSRIFSDIYLETSRGPSNLYLHITPDYTNARLDSLNNDLYLIVYSTDPLSLWTSGTTTIYCPCFFLFSEQQCTFIPTEQLEQLLLRVITNSSYLNMGLTSDITDFLIRAQFTFYKVENPIRNLGVNYTALSRTLLISDVFYELPLALALGINTTNINISCPYLSFNMTIIVRDTSQNYLRVQKFIFYSGYDIITNMDKTCNYSLMNGSTENNQIGSLTYWFSVKRDRTCNLGAMNMKDTYAKNLLVYFDTTNNSNYSLYVLFEYYDLLLINEYGQFIRQNHY